MNAKESLQFFAQRAAQQIGNAYDIAQTLKIDYSNVKKFMRDYRKIPISKAFEILDYTQAKVVVFRNM